MKTKAAVLWGLHQQWEVEEVDLDGPKENEVLVKVAAAGLCHSDDHLITGDMPMQLPVVGGHDRTILSSTSALTACRWWWGRRERG